MIRIYLVDDEILFIKGLQSILTQFEGVEVLKTFTAPEDLLKELEENEERPDIIMVDMKMPNINGIELTKILAKKTPEVKIIGLSSHYSNVLIFEMLKIGASAYLPKNATIPRLEKTIRHVAEEGFYFEELVLNSYHESIASVKAQKELVNQGLTSREVDVLILICEQLTTQEIAEKLFISLKTVERHRTNLFQKTEAKNVVGLVLFALKNQLISNAFL
jgi:DNA-binding NarL/FixJ family response regulator